MRDVLFRYAPGGFELRVPALEVPERQRVAVVGPSGSGKTTLLHLMAGILVPMSGRVEVGGQQLSAMNDGARRRHRLASIGMVFQGIELVDYLSVRDNVLLPGRINRALKVNAALRDRAAMLLERVGLAPLAERRVSGLSHGERQRVGICRALIASPGLLLADEPTSALDDRSAEDVLSLLMEVVAEQGATLVMLTHDRSLLERFDRVVRVDDGVAKSVEHACAGGDA